MLLLQGTLPSLQIPPECPQEWAEVIGACLQTHPACRPSATMLVTYLTALCHKLDSDEAQQQLIVAALSTPASLGSEHWVQSAILDADRLKIESMDLWALCAMLAEGNAAGSLNQDLIGVYQGLGQSQSLFHSRTESKGRDKGTDSGNWQWGASQSLSACLPANLFSQ